MAGVALIGVGMTVRGRHKSEAELNGAGGGIRTHEPLRDEVLSLAPLTRLGDPRAERKRVANNALRI